MRPRTFIYRGLVITKSNYFYGIFDNYTYSIDPSMSLGNYISSLIKT